MAIGVSQIDVPQWNSEVRHIEYFFLVLGFLFKIRAVVPSHREISRRMI